MIVRNIKFLFFIFLVSFIIRVVFFIFIIDQGAHYFRGSNDAREYNDIAIQISKGNGASFSNLAPGFYSYFKDEISTKAVPKTVPNFYRLPGYPLFLAFFYALCGTNPQIPLWFQIVLASLIPILIFFLSLALVPKNLLLAKLSAIISAFYFGFVLYSCVLFSEILFLFFFISFLIYFFKSFDLFFCANKKKFNLLLFIISGFFLGIASLIRATGPYILALVIIFLNFSRFTVREKFKACSTLFLSWLSIVFPWILRNWLVTGYVFFHTLPGVHFFVYPAIRLGMQNYTCGYQTARIIMLNKLKHSVEDFENKKGAQASEIEICMLSEKMVKKIFLNNPFAFLKLSMHHMFKVTFGPHATMYDELNICSSKNNFAATVWNFLLKIWIYFEYIFIFGFFLLMFYFFVPSFTCLLSNTIPFVFAFIFFGLAEGFARLRIPIMPLVIILGIYFWLHAINKFLVLVRSKSG